MTIFATKITIKTKVFFVKSFFMLIFAGK